MTAARQYDWVRTTAAARSIFDGRTIPAGTQGMVLEARPDGTCLVEVTFLPQTASHDGDFAQAVLAEDQYEIIQPSPAARLPGGPVGRIAEYALDHSRV
jgi:hypothetical protein